LLHYY